MKFKVKIQVEFEVESSDEALTKSNALEAADEAVFNNIALTTNGIHVVDQVTQFVDGFGACIVRLA